MEPVDEVRIPFIDAPLHVEAGRTLNSLSRLVMFSSLRPSRFASSPPPRSCHRSTLSLSNTIQVDLQAVVVVHRGVAVDREEDAVSPVDVVEEEDVVASREAEDADEVVTELLRCWKLRFRPLYFSLFAFSPRTIPALCL